jgi:hypothetical protein
MKRFKKILHAPVGRLIFFVLACALEGAHSSEQKWNWIVEGEGQEDLT